jgi:hypothetical protein
MILEQGIFYFSFTGLRPSLWMYETPKGIVPGLGRQQTKSPPAAIAAGGLKCTTLLLF